MNAAIGDLHLQATASAAIDKAVLQADCTTDWDGRTRPLGAAADIGASEYDPSAGVPPDPPKNVHLVA